MPKTRHAYSALLPRKILVALFSALRLWLGFGLLDPVLARMPYDSVKMAEGWAWSQISKERRPTSTDAAARILHSIPETRMTSVGNLSAATSLPVLW